MRGWTSRRKDATDERLAAFDRLLDGLFARFVSVSTAALPDALQTTVSELGAFVGADRSYIISYDWSAGTSTMTHEWCGPDVPSCFDDEQDLPISVGPRMQERLDALEVNQIDDVSALDDGWAEDRRFLDSEGVTAILEVPFALDGVLAGVIGFDAVHGPMPWRPEDVTALRAVASLLAHVLARSVAESALASTHDELRAVFGDAPAPLMLSSATGEVLRANRAAAALFGVSREDLVGSNALERVHPDDMERSGPVWARLLERNGPDSSSEKVRMLTPDGYRWHRVDSAATRRESGEFRYSTVHLVDIDDAHRTATRLGRSERRFGALIESLPDAVMRFDPSHEVVFANDAAIRVAQSMATAGVPMRGGWPRLEPFAASTLRESLRIVFSKGRPVTVEYPVGSGEATIWNESTFVPEFDADGEVESVLLVARDVTERHHHELDLAHRATHDSLTGLPNRAMLLETMHRAASRIGTGGHDTDGHCSDGDGSDGDGSDGDWTGGSLAVLFIDVDRFKTINDTLGHGVGDELLRIVATRFAQVLRPSDVLARLGGDEFTVLLTDLGADEALQVAHRLQSSLRAPIDVCGSTFRPTVSIGLVETAEPTDPDELLRWADAAMYEAKAKGRDRVCRFDERMRAEVEERDQIDRDLTGALERDELEVHYQPEVDLVTGAVLGCEALVRWRHPQRGLMTADRFVPVAEENGTIAELGRWVLATTCRTVAAWRTAGLVDDAFVLRVNLSARQIDHAGLATEVAALLHESGLPPSQLCLEITETALMRDVRTGLAALTALHDVGITIAIDDFGTGYSSLSYLKRFPLDVLKVDRSFVDGLPDDADDMAITTAILHLAGSLGLTVTAEGVESDDQRRALIALGCSRAQGYLFGRPVPADEFVTDIAASARKSCPTPTPR